MNTKTIKLFSLLLLFSNIIFSQSLLFEKNYCDENYYKFNSIAKISKNKFVIAGAKGDGDCSLITTMSILDNYGNTLLQLPDSFFNNIIDWNNTTCFDLKFSKFDSTIYIATTDAFSSDVSPFQYSIFNFDTLLNLIWYKNIELHNIPISGILSNGLLLKDDYTDNLNLLNFYILDTIWQIKAYDDLSKILVFNDSTFFYTSTDTIFKVDKNSNLIDLKKYNFPIQNLSKFNDSIIVCSASYMYLFDNILNIVDSVSINNVSYINSIESTDSTIVVIAKYNNENDSIKIFNSNLELINSSELPQNELEYYSAIPFEQNIVTTGMNDNQNHSFLKSFDYYGNFIQSNSDITPISFLLDNVNITAYNEWLSYNFNFTINIKNNGLDTIKSLYLYSPPYMSFMCVDFSYYNFFDSLNIIPNETKELSFILTQSHYYLEIIDSIPFCFYTIAPNNKIDNLQSNDKICDVVIVNIDKIENEQKFNIYPNPAENTLNIELFDYSKNKDSQITIFNIFGEVLLKFSNFTDKIDISSLHHGTYFIQITNNKNTNTLKFIK